MKHLLSLTALLLCGLMLMSGCGDSKPTETTPQTTTTQPINDTPAAPISKTLSITYTPASGDAIGNTGEGSTELNVTNAFKKGDQITVTLAEGQHYLAFCLAKDTVEESILYLPNSTFTYEVPNVAVSYPKDLTRRATITARIPTDEELAASRNLALNPADLIDAENAYPHISATSVYDINNENNRLCFESRNIIDGFTQNNGHGEFPLQSWGPASTMSENDILTLAFGRKVNITELTVYLRADFANNHDTYWDSCTVIFFNGSTKISEQELAFTKTADAQSFTLEAPVTATSVKFTSFNKVPGSDWAAWMELQVIGSDVIG